METTAFASTAPGMYGWGKSLGDLNFSIRSSQIGSRVRTATRAHLIGPGPKHSKAGENQIPQRRRIQEQHSPKESFLSRLGIGGINQRPVSNREKITSDFGMQEIPHPDENVYLNYNWKPVMSEINNEIKKESIEGEIPKDLRGKLYRIGPNNRYLPSADQRFNWFDGDGMIHVVSIEDGENDEPKVTYANRWVRSSFYKQELVAQRPPLNITSVKGIHGLIEVISELGSLLIQNLLLGFKYTKDRIDAFSPFGVANTNLLYTRGSLYALYESDGPWRINPSSLTTESFNDKDIRPQGSNIPYTAHPKQATNGEIISFGIVLRPGPLGGLIFYRNHPSDSSQKTKFKVPGMNSYLHDICISKNFIIFMDSPCRVDVLNLVRGGGPLRWDYSGRSRIGVIPRNEEGKNLLNLETMDDVKWFPLEEKDTGFIFHWGNGFNDDKTIVASGSHFEVFDISFLDGGIPMDYKQLPKMNKFEIDIQTGQVRRTDLLENDEEDLHAVSDFPVWNQCLTGGERRTDFLYGSFAFFEANYRFVGPGDTVPPSDVLTTIGGLAGFFKYDFGDPSHPKVKKIGFPKDVGGGECFYVPKKGAIDEDEGYLLGIVSYLPREKSNPSVYSSEYESYLWIFDAKFPEIPAFEKFDESMPHEAGPDNVHGDGPDWVGAVPNLLASIRLPSRVPWGLHNIFLDDDFVGSPS